MRLSFCPSLGKKVYRGATPCAVRNCHVRWRRCRGKGVHGQRVPRCKRRTANGDAKVRKARYAKHVRRWGGRRGARGAFRRAITPAMARGGTAMLRAGACVCKKVTCAAKEKKKGVRAAEQARVRARVT